MPRDNSSRNSVVSGSGRLTQDGRIAQLSIPALDKDKLVLSRLEAYEGMSELFEVRIDALSEEADIDFDKALGTKCSVSLQTHNDITRYFSGFLTEAQWVGIREDYQGYRLVLRPWLWLLGRKANCRIFRKKTAKQIIKKIFEEHGFSDAVKDGIERDSQEFDYCVQYRETDLAFVSRLMEEYGFYTYFKHEQDKHVLHLADSIGGHEQIVVPIFDYHGSSRTKSTGPTLPFAPLAGEDRREFEHIYQWTAERRFRTGKFKLADYDWRKATTKLESEKQCAEKYPRAKVYESYDYPGRWTERDEGNHLVKVRLEGEQALDHRMHAAGDAPSLYAGAVFALKDHEKDDGDYIVVRATHSFGVQRYRSGAGAMDDEVYHGHYEVQEKNHPFRAPQITPKPRIYGPQTAFVVRAEGTDDKEEIDVDKDGCIVVNFHWNMEDRQKHCSRRVRVAQMWAGKNWGWQVIPRVGQEVVVVFLEGDPDQPLVTGAVYNSDFPCPFKLPDDRTQSGVKTDSSLSSKNKGYNQLIFEDKAKEEKIDIRAEKDLVTDVRNIETRKIAGDKENKSPTDPSRTTTITVGADHLTLENGDWKVKVVGKVEIKATQEIVLNCGDVSRIVMKPDGITISAPNIDLKGTGKITQTAPMIEIN